MSSFAQHAPSANQATILSWLDEVREAIRVAPWSDMVDFDGIDAFDVLLSPVYLAMLNAVRNGSSAPPTTKRVTSQLRDWAYQAKVAWRERQTARGSAAPGPTDFLFWTRDVTHTVIMQPIAAAMIDQQDNCRMLACQAKIFRGLERLTPNPVYTVGAWPQVVRAARREGARRARQLALHGAWQLPVFPDPAVARPAAVVRSAVLQYLPLAAEAIANARCALAAFRPKVLVVGNDLTTEGRAGCRVAAAEGVPSAAFMHGSISGDRLQRYHIADLIGVYAPTHRQVLAQHGLDTRRIAVCGAPYLDSRPRQSGQVHPQLQTQLGLKNGTPWVLVATSGPGNRISHEHHRQVIQELKSLARAIRPVPLVVKLHRKDHVDYYREALEGHTHDKMIVVAEDTPGFPRKIFDWLQGCSLVLTGASTTAVEAMLMDVPVVTMDFCDEIHDVDFIDAGATIHVTTREGLQQAVQGILGEPMPPAELRARAQAYLTDAFDALDGQSSRRCAQALRTLADLAPNSNRP